MAVLNQNLNAEMEAIYENNIVPTASKERYDQAWKEFISYHDLENSEPI